MKTHACELNVDYEGKCRTCGKRVFERVSDRAEKPEQTVPSESSGSLPNEELALRMIREVTDGALDASTLIEAVLVLISQRDNARHYADTFRQELKKLGREFG